MAASSTGIRLGCMTFSGWVEDGFSLSITWHAVHPLIDGVGFLYASPRLRAVSAASAREETLSLR
jgi:hypothetical protein